MHTKNGNSTGILNNNKDLPMSGIISAHPRRTKELTNYLKNTELHSDYRGYQVYTGDYNGKKIFLANTNIGSGSSAVLIEELIVKGAKKIIRLGTSDNDLSAQNNNTCYLVNRTFGALGIMNEYGFDQKEIEAGVSASESLVNTIYQVSQSLNFKNIEKTSAYHIDSYYAHLNPERFCKSASVIKERTKKFKELGANVRDMESATLFMIGSLRNIETACILQSVVKHGVDHEYNGQDEVIDREKEVITLALEGLVA